MATYQDVVDLARVPLNDSDKARYSDSDMLSYANYGILTMLKRRPDLFIGSFSSLPTATATLVDLFPLSAAYIQPLADYVTARAEMMDDEHVDSGRTALLIQLFSADAQP